MSELTMSEKWNCALHANRDGFPPIIQDASVDYPLMSRWEAVKYFAAKSGRLFNLIAPSAMRVTGYEGTKSYQSSMRAKATALRNLEGTFWDTVNLTQRTSDERLASNPYNWPEVRFLQSVGRNYDYHATANDADILVNPSTREIHVASEIGVVALIHHGQNEDGLKNVASTIQLPDDQPKFVMIDLPPLVAANYSQRVIDALQAIDMVAAVNEQQDAVIRRVNPN